MLPHNQPPTLSKRLVLLITADPAQQAGSFSRERERGLKLLRLCYIFQKEDLHDQYSNVDSILLLVGKSWRGNYGLDNADVKNGVQGFHPRDIKSSPCG